MRKFICLFLVLSAINFTFSQKQNLEKEINKIIKDKKATVGVAVIYNGKDTLTVNNQYLYPMMSVYKFHQGLAILNYLEQNNLPLNTEYFIGKSDLVPDTYSPLRDKKPEGNFKLSVKEMLEYVIGQSDNNVSNYLFKYVISPKQTEEYIKKLGIEAIAITKTEEQMAKNHDNQYLNWTRPLSAAILFEKLRKENILSKENENFMINTLIETNTGSNKIKGLLPQNITVGHKTGNSYRDKGIKAADNDTGFVILPNGKSYNLAVFVMNSLEEDDTNAEIIAEVSKAIYDYYRKK